MSKRTKENPLTAGILADEANQGAVGVAALPNRISRYAGAHQRALLMADYAESIGELSMGRKLTDCGHYLLFRHYTAIDEVRLHAASLCRKHLLCPLCAIRRGQKALEAYAARVEYVQATKGPLRAFHVICTVKDGADLLERFDHLRGTMRRMTRARLDYLKAPKKRPHVEFAKAIGGVHSIEVKRGKNSGLWHPHVHMIWLCHEAPNEDELRKEWEGWAGDSWSCKVVPFHDQADLISGFQEVFKYALKFSDMALPDNWEAFQTLSGKRLVDSFGDLRGVVIPDELDEPLDGQEFVELLYRWMGKGYGLAERREGHLTELPSPPARPLPPPKRSYTNAAFWARVAQEKAHKGGIGGGAPDVHLSPRSVPPDKGRSP